MLAVVIPITTTPDMYLLVVCISLLPSPPGWPRPLLVIHTSGLLPLQVVDIDDGSQVSHLGYLASVWRRPTDLVVVPYRVRLVGSGIYLNK